MTPLRTDQLDEATAEALLRYVPACYRRILVHGLGDGAAGAFLRQREGVEVYGLDADARRAEAAAPHFDAAGQWTPGGGDPPFPEAYFDTLVFAEPTDPALDLAAVARALRPHLTAEGVALVLLPAEPVGRTHEETLAAVATAGWAPYCQWRHESAPGAAMACLVMLTAPGYDPLAEAREHFDAGRPDWSYEVLSNIPTDYLRDPESQIAVQTERLLSLLAWRQREGQRGILAAFNQAQLLFNDIVNKQPDCVPAYQCLAQFWRLLGDPGMARRTLESLCHVYPEEGVKAQLAGLGAAPATAPAFDPPPPWEPERYRPRVLYVMHPRLHYGLDVLYDGLCSVLGDDRVVDFPFKPTLHGNTPAEMAHYPCSFNRPGEAMGEDTVLRALQDGAFDLVLYGDCEAGLPEDLGQRLSRAAGDTPFCVVDAIDESMDTREELCEVLGRESVTAYFKREMMNCCDYGPNAYPLPFAYADMHCDSSYAEYRPNLFFWAGHRRFALRRLYLDRLEKVLGINLDGLYAPECYNQCLRESLIGLNLFGFGFDTVRYWELPAHGCMLLSERLPIRIPHDFVDGESAVFWDTLPELEEKLTHYLNHPEEARAIARAGHAHFLQHHTGSARARQLLAWVQRLVVRR